MTNRTRLALVAAAAIVVIAALVIALPSSKNSSSTSTTATPAAVVSIHIQGGKPVGGVQKITAFKGGRVRFSVTSDVADEIHVHGYDFHKDVTAGGHVSFDFPATIDGIFVVELEHRSEQIGSLEVNP